jgi:hypothetical protein
MMKKDRSILVFPAGHIQLSFIEPMQVAPVPELPEGGPT